MECSEDSGFASIRDTSCSSVDYNLTINSIITDKMVREETKLEEIAVKEEESIKCQMLEKEQKQNMEEQCYKRLHLLLSRSSIYAQFMTDKLKRDSIKEAKKASRLEKHRNSDMDSNMKSKKRKMEVNVPPTKKQKSEMTVIDVFRKKSGEYGEQNDENKETLNSPITDQSKDITGKQPKLLTGAVMHPYQIEGFEWLKVLFENGVNGILADEMGLGKTIQSIAFISHLIEMGVSGPFFICGPLSTVPNWFLEIQKFAPSLPALVYHGDKEERKVLRKKIFKKVKNKDVCCYPIVITSYQIALIDAKLIGGYDWKLLIIDEAHRIKNFQCKLVNALKFFNVSHRLLLTGTPLQNNLSELWSLLNFILPEIFDDLRVFESWFDVTRLTKKDGDADIVAKEQEKQIVSIIHEILTPFLLRRTKIEVDLKLPKKKEVVVHAPFTQLQKEYYTAALNRSIKDMLHGDKNESEVVDVNSGRPKRHKNFDYSECFKMYDDKKFEDFPENLQKPVLSKLSYNDEKDTSTAIGNDVFADIHVNTRNISMLLRKICVHPYLVSYPLEESGEYKIDEDLIKSSGKFLVLDVLLPALKKRGHKVILFSQFVTMLEILEDYCNFRNYSYCKLYGTMRLDERDTEIKAFKEAQDKFIFLISTRAGGLGINLANADTVIIFDSDWNPQGDLQAQDRCHRIGQTKPVVVYRLIVPNTIDQQIFERATAKRKLEKVIIKEGRFNSKNSVPESQKLSIEELLRLLKSCESNSYIQTNNREVISPAELERLLDRSDLL